MPGWVLALIIVGSLGAGVLLGVLWFAWQFGKGMNW